MRIRLNVLLTTFVAILILISAAQAGSDSERAIYAHYMGCLPAGGSAMCWAYRSQGRNVDLNKVSDPMAQIGGNYVNWPLVPLVWTDKEVTMRQSAELEIQRGMRMGLNGFSFDAWAGGDGARKLFETFMDVCQEKHLDFQLTVCLDPSCHAIKTDRYDDSAGGHVGGMYDTVRWLLTKYRDHPNLARRNGKPLIFTYSTQTFLTNEIKSMGNGNSEPARWKEMLKLLQGLRDMAKKEFNTELYVHFDMDGAFNSIDLRNIKGFRAPRDPGPITAELAAYLAKGDGELQGYDAIGGFLGVHWNANYDIVSAATHAAGKEWAIPMIHQYVSRGGSIITAPGTDLMRRWWEAARSTKSTLIQYVTWNDYGEDTSLAPGTSTRYTVFELVAHQIAWWKTGKEPTYDHDKVFFIYRRYPASAKPYPYNARRWVDGALEVSTILTAPATIRLPGRDASYEAPAGLFVKQFPLKVGEVAAEVVRGGKVVAKITSPDPITDKPMREDNAMVCYSSEYQRQWKLDFPNDPVENYAENGDDDGDGLPNWYEMLYFGKPGDYRTATVADPNADPDGDGLTNLQEYLQQTNPLKKTEAYTVGYVWNFDVVHRNKVSLRYDPDSTGRRVWQYLYRFGDAPVPMDGNYLVMPSAAMGNVPYAGEMSQHTPAQTDNPKWTRAYGWVARQKKPDGEGWWINLRASANNVILISWESPIEGVVSVKLTTAARADHRNKTTLAVQRSNPFTTLETRQVLGNESTKINIPSIEVKPGDRLYFVGGVDEVTLDTLDIELVQLRNTK